MTLENKDVEMGSELANILPAMRNPSIRHKVLDHQLQADTASQKNKWSLCCYSKGTDARLLQFIATFIISIVLLIFSCYQLSYTSDCEGTNLYTGLITLVVGVWLKSPMDR
jgi:hypothetical protein